MAATFNVQGTNLTVSSASLQVSFRGADIVGIANQSTGEQYLRNASSGAQMNLTLVQPPNQPLAAAGSWSVNAAGTSASLTFTDSNRTVSAVVSVDPATQEVIVDLDGKANQGGVERLIWGATGFDMAAGRFILPAQGGISLTSASFGAASSYYFTYGAWEAPLALFQGALGGVALYSTDTKSLTKDLVLSGNQQQTANASFQVQAPGPWNSAIEAGPIEWRLAAYTGEWQSGARIYRDWHNSTLAPAPLTGARAWAAGIHTVIEVDGGHPYQNSTLDSLASVVAPSQTLLYLVDWRTQGYDVGYPDYTWDPSTPAFIAHAHQLGFYVMLHTDSLGVAPTSPDFAAVQQYQIKDSLNLQPQGWNWNQPPSTPQRYALINPAASAYRQLFLARVTPAIQTLHPDAIHLDFSTVYNDGNGLIEGKNFNQGLALLHRDLLAAFPNLVLGAEETSDMIAPWESFSQPLFWSAMNLDPSATPPVPISAYVLGNVHRYWHLGTTNPYEQGFVSNLAQYEGQAVLPTFHSGVPNYSQPDMARFLRVISAFQTYALQPAWDTTWSGAEMKYQGVNAASATVTDSGSLVQSSLQVSGSSSLLYERAHGVNQLNSPLSVPNWPAWNGTLTLGLDPAIQYWLDTIANNPALPHVTSLPAGARIGLGTGTLVTSQFAYFQILPSGSQSAFNFFSNLWLATSGVTFNGVDYPLANGATADLTTMTVGGVTRQAISSSPPWQAQRGGETFIEYNVPVPSPSGTSLSFAAGILDAAIGQRQGPMTFKVEINGAILWQQDVSTGAWQAGSIDLSSWAGRIIRVRFVSNPGPSGNPNFGWCGWSALQTSTPASGTLSGITVSAPQVSSPSKVAVTGGTASVSNGTVTVNSLPAGGTILVFPGQPAPVAAGQALLDIPSTLSQSSNQQLAGPPGAAFAGTGNIGPTTSGGVTKQRTLLAFAPSNGQTIFSWMLQLPAAAGLAFSFSAGFWDGVSPPAPQGYLMSVRVNGQFLWQHNINVPASWQNGIVDLSQWAGQTVLLELITDSQGPNYDDFTSWGDLTFTSAATVPALSLSRRTLNFGVNGALVTSAQSINVSLANGPGLIWTASSNQPNITVSPASGTGNGSFLVTVATGPSGGITVTASGAANSPQHVQVNLVSAGSTNLFGSFDTPVNNTAGISGAIPVTGWVLDGVEASKVDIWREPLQNETTAPNGLVYIGDAVFVAGSRPDVEKAYPAAPWNYRAGWGYMLLTNFLPNSNGSPGRGNGTYKLHAIAHNSAGTSVDLDVKTITVDNAHASKPFGTIDTPAQGATVSGNAYVNFGWALTQNPYSVPTDGSTLAVYVDGVAAGRPAYNQYRSDIATLFPGLANSNGAVGFFFLDTTKLANGVHTIAWTVSDNANRSDGIGSRYFNVFNGSGASAVPEEAGRPLSATQVPESMEVEEAARIEMPVGAAAGYLLFGVERRPLPIGSTLKDGVFFWQLGPGFLGTYDLEFERPHQEPLRLRLIVRAKGRLR